LHLSISINSWPHPALDLFWSTAARVAIASPKRLKGRILPAHSAEYLATCNPAHSQFPGVERTKRKQFASFQEYWRDDRARKHRKFSTFAIPGIALAERKPVLTKKRHTGAIPQVFLLVRVDQRRACGSRQTFGAQKYSLKLP
jgi:hypothetical protein